MPVLISGDYVCSNSKSPYMTLIVSVTSYSKCQAVGDQYGSSLVLEETLCCRRQGNKFVSRSCDADSSDVIG